jgi:photosystem II stability/assembly factor-like uncharacterized protein
VWIGGTRGTLLRTRDGGKTFARATLEGGEGVASIWALSPDDVWVVGEHRVHRLHAGTTRATLSVPLDNHGEARVSGSSASDVWIASGELAHTTDGGTSWTSIELGTRDVWTHSASDVWVDVPFGVQHSTDAGARWAPATLLISEEDSFHVRGRGAAEVWIFGAMSGPSSSTDGGATWKPQRLPGSGGKLGLVTWSDLWPSGVGAALAATSAGLWSGSATGPWRRVLATGEVSALWASGPGDVWAVGRRGTILHGG